MGCGDRCVVVEIVPGEEIGPLTAAMPVRLEVSDEDDDGVWVASDDHSTIWGDGDSIEDAIADYALCVFFELAEFAVRGRLGRELAAEMAAVRQRWF